MGSSSKLLSFILILFLFQSLVPSGISSDEDDDLEELLAIDEEEDNAGAGAARPSEAEVLKMAQRVVLELTNENAKKVVESNPLVLVLGYTPWCPRSAELMPRFAEAAMALKEMGSPILVAKVDAERHGKGAAQLGIRGYPTILLFVNGSEMTYTGGFTG